jgi:hypothetical protein
MTDASKGKRGRPPSDNPRSAFVQVRARPEWVGWLRSTSEETGRDASDILAEGVALWARKYRRPAPPER